MIKTALLIFIIVIGGALIYKFIYGYERKEKIEPVITLKHRKFFGV